MGRAASTDPLHNFRFHMKSIDGSPVHGIPGTSPADVLQPEGITDSIPGGGAEAGFSSVTTPELTVEVAEYREGIWTYTKKFAGVPTVNEITANRGVTLRGTPFYNWVLAAIEGDEYRADLTVYHVHRPRRSPAQDTSTPDGSAAALEAVTNPANSLRYILREVIPTRVKPAGDLDAGTSDISLSEIEIAQERFDIERPTGSP